MNLLDKLREEEKREEYAFAPVTAARAAADRIRQTAASPYVGGYPEIKRTAPNAQQQLAAANQRVAEYTYKQFVESDDYASLAKRYSKKGLQAMDDTLGRIAARTGGIASSYAGSAAQQEYGNYMYELEKMAQEMYGTERDRLTDERDKLYDRMRDERDFNLDLALRDMAAEQDKEDRKIAAEQEDYDRRAALAKILAGYGDFSLYEELGLTREQTDNMKNAYDMAQQVEILEALDLADDTDDDNEPAPSDDEIKEQQQTDYDQAVYEAVYETIKNEDPKRGQNIAKLITTPEDWAADKQGYRTYSDYLTAELKKIGLDVSPIINNIDTQKAQTGGSGAYGVDEYLRTINDLYDSEGVAAVRDEFASLLDEKPEDLTYDEWEKVVNYLKTLR